MMHVVGEHSREGRRKGGSVNLCQLSVFWWGHNSVLLLLVCVSTEG